MLRVQVTGPSGRVGFEHDGGPIELGRDPRRERRQVIADPLVSNDQLRVAGRPDGRVLVENLSRRVPVYPAGGPTLPPGEGRVFDPPVRLTVGETLVEIDTGAPVDVDPGSLLTVAAPVARSKAEGPAPFPALGEAPGAEELVRWLEAVVAVQRSSASSPDFFRETARAAVELIGLDRALVLLRRGDDWEVAARHGDAPPSGEEFSRTALGLVVRQRRTFYNQGPPGPAAAESLAEVSAVVAAPVLSDDGREVVGAVYGARDRRAGRAEVAVRPLEALLVQVLAAAVGVGLARSVSDAEAARRRVQFEQFFSADLARELDRDPSLIDGRERVVTVLFTDLRGFSRISERLDPSATCALIGDVMQALTTRVRDQGGVVVDYLGDGLLAMWNAPADQEAHAPLACRAALAMRAELPPLNDRWRDRVGGPLDLGVGINTGPALVGNTGSRSRFKYGPLGHTVNLASRVEGATKQLGVPVLITGSTRERLTDEFATRRLCRARVVGIAGAVDLYELQDEAADPGCRARREVYEAGLAEFEAGRWAEAGRTLYTLLAGESARYDLPTLTLVGRSVECLRDPTRPFDPVLELTSK